MQTPIQFQKLPPITRLLDVWGTTANSNEIASFGYSNANNVAIRMYDNNTPSLGGIFGYNSNSFYFKKDTGLVNVGINTTLAQSQLHVVGDVQVSGTFTTSNLVVSGNSALTNYSAIDGVIQKLSLYNPTATDSTSTPYKTIFTSDSVSSNLILMTFSVIPGRYLYTANIPYRNLDPVYSIETNIAKIGLYAKNTTNFKGNLDTPTQSTDISIYTTTDQMSTNVIFYIDAFVNTDYTIGITGKGNNLQIAGNYQICSGSLISIAGLGTNETTNKIMQVTPIKQTFILSAPTSNFALQTSGLYQITQTSNVEVFRNGIKLAYYSPTSNDYTVTYTNDSTNTYFNVKTASFISTNELIDIAISPETTTSTAFQSSYLYQNITSLYQYYSSLNISAANISIYQYNSNIGIGTTLPREKLDIIGSMTFTSNVGIGTTNPLQSLHIENDLYMNGVITYNYETISSSNTLLSSNLTSVIKPFGTSGTFNYILPTLTNTTLLRKHIYLDTSYYSIGNYTFRANNVLSAVGSNTSLMYADWVINKWNFYYSSNL